MIDIPVSVIIPAYNAADYIEATLASVHAQTVGVDEIIVVDDGSTDETVAIARQFGVQVIEERNRGVSAARNLGIERARNPWIALLDADDLWLPEKLERQWFAVTAAPSISFVFTDFSQFDEKRVRNASVLHEVHRQFAAVARTPLGNEAYLCDKASLSAVLLFQNLVQPSALLVRREIAVDLGGFDLKLLACQDYDFVFRLTRTNAGAYIDLPLVRYRRHATATTSNIPKSREGLANVALRTLARPYEYSPATVEHFRRTLPALFLKCGFAHLRYGSPERAREWLRRSVRERFTLAAAVLYVATFPVGTRAGQRARSVALRVASRLKAIVVRT